MDYLEQIFGLFTEEGEPNTPEYRENHQVQLKLMDELTAAMGEEMTDKVSGIFGEHELMECERFFRLGLRLGMELVRLS